MIEKIKILLAWDSKAFWYNREGSIAFLVGMSALIISTKNESIAIQIFLMLGVLFGQLNISQTETKDKRIRTFLSPLISSGCLWIGSFIATLHYSLESLTLGLIASGLMLLTKKIRNIYTFPMLLNIVLLCIGRIFHFNSWEVIHACIGITAGFHIGALLNRSWWQTNYIGVLSLKQKDIWFSIRLGACLTIGLMVGHALKLNRLD